MKQDIVIKVSQVFFVFLSLSLLAGNSHARDINKTAISAGTGQNAPIAYLLNSGKEISLEHLSAGRQAVIQDMSRSIFFAGRNVGLSGFSGVMGMASDTAYIMVARGQVQIDGQEASPGDIFILLPYGGEILKQRYDAARFINAWPEEDRQQNYSVFSSFNNIAKTQSTAMFFGRYEATSFNVSAPGSAEQESARRTVVGADIIQAIRFSGEREPEKIEHRVVSEYAKALVTGDAGILAALTDPGPYGAFDLRGGADGARLLMAQQILKQHDWQGLIAGVQFVKSEDGQYWLLRKPEGTAKVVLRPIGDFVYVKNIAWEASQ